MKTVPENKTLKAQIKKIIPLSERVSYIKRTLVYNENSKCYIGISISNPHFQGEYLYCVFDWIMRNFKYCCVFIDDYFHQYNEKAFTGKSQSDCSVIARQRGLEISTFVIKFIEENFKETNRFRIIMSSEIAKENLFQQFSLFFKKRYTKDKKFKDGILKSATDYVDRQVKRGNLFSVSKENAVALSSLYLLEEISVFSFLCEKGYDVEVYPGPELPILVSIANKDFEGMPPALLHRVNIELEIKRIV